MEKKIIITVIENEDKSLNIKTETSNNISLIEVLGTLRYEEKRIWLKIVNSSIPIKNENLEQEKEMD